MKRNAITYLLQAVLQDRIEGAKVYVEWGAKAPQRGFVVERRERQIDIRLDEKWFVNEVDIIELWKNLRDWVDWWNTEEAKNPSHQTRLDDFYDIGDIEERKQRTLEEWF